MYTTNDYVQEKKEKTTNEKEKRPRTYKHQAQRPLEPVSCWLAALGRLKQAAAEMRQQRREELSPPLGREAAASSLF